MRECWDGLDPRNRRAGNSHKKNAAAQASSPQFEIHQTFFIGDGRDLNGQVQRFHAPQGATRLFLGFAETFGFSGPGLPGFYDDNGGSLTATLKVSPP